MVKAWETQEELGSHTCGKGGRGRERGEGGRGEKAGREEGGEGRGTAGFEERVDVPIVPQDNRCVN